MLQRLLGVVVLVLAVALGAAAPALAVEEGGAPEEREPAPSIDEIGTQNKVSREFLPPPAEPPAFFPWLYYPLFIAGVLVGSLLLFFFLVWQPRFAEERRRRRRR